MVDALLCGLTNRHTRQGEGFCADEHSMPDGSPPGHMIAGDGLCGFALSMPKGPNMSLTDDISRQEGCQNPSTSFRLLPACW